MSIFVPEIAAKYGALDSNALQEDRPVSAYVANQVARSSNRINSKGVHWFSIPWPSRDDPDISVDTPSAILKKPFSTPVWRQWTPVLGPFAAPKKPGLSLAEFRFDALLNSGDSIQIQVATRAAPFVASPNSAAPNLLTITSPSTSWQIYSLDDLPVVRGGMETIAVYMRSVSQGALGNETTFGADNAGDVGLVQRDLFFGVDTSWFTTDGNSPSDYASSGHYVILTDPLGNGVAARTVTFIGPVVQANGLATTHQALSFSPLMEQGQVSLLRQGSTFEIRKVPDIALQNVAARLKGRTV